MPVVDRQKERAIVERARSRGMSDDQIKQAILTFRGQQPSVPSAQTPVTPPAVPQSGNKGFLSGVGNLALGAVKGLGSSVAGIGEMGAKLMSPIDKAFGVSPIKTGETERSLGQLGVKDALTPTNTAQKIGFGAEQIGEFFLPGGAALRGAKAAETAIQGAKLAKSGTTLLKGIGLGSKAAKTGGLLLESGAKLGSKVGAEALASGAVTAAQTGGDVKETLKSGLLSGAFPVAGKLIGSVTKKVSPFAKTLFSGVAGKTTGAGEAAISEAFSNRNVIKFARQAGKDGPEALLNEALEGAYKGLDNLTSTNSKAYKQAIAKIKALPKDMSSAISDIRSNIVRNAQENFGVRFADGRRLNNLDFNASDVVEGSNSVQRAFDRLFGEPINSVADMDRVKKSLGRLAKGAPMGSPAQALIYQMKDAVSQSLKTKIPGYAKEMQRFSEAISLTDEIEKALSLRDTNSRDTAVRKLMSTMRQNNELRKEFMETLGAASGEDITGKIAGATLGSITPRGIMGQLAPTAGGIGLVSQIANPAAWPTLLLFLASTSPRAVAEAVNLMSKVKGTSVPPIIQQQLKNIIIRAMRNPESN